MLGVRERVAGGPSRLINRHGRRRGAGRPPSSRVAGASSRLVITTDRLLSRLAQPVREPGGKNPAARDSVAGFSVCRTTDRLLPRLAQPVRERGGKNLAARDFRRRLLESAEPLTGCCRGSRSRSGNPEERSLPPAIPSQASQSADAGRRARLRLHSPLVLKAAWRLRSPRRPLNAGGRGWTGPARPPRGPRRRRTRPVAGRSRTPAPRPRARWRGDRDAGVCAPPAGCPRP